MSRYQDNYSISFTVENTNSVAATLNYTITIRDGSTTMTSFSGTKSFSANEQADVSVDKTYQYDSDEHTPGRSRTVVISAYFSATGYTSSSSSSTTFSINGSAA